MTSNYLTIGELARFFGVSVTHVRNLVRWGYLVPAMTAVLRKGGRPQHLFGGVEIEAFERTKRGRRMVERRTAV